MRRIFVDANVIMAGSMSRTGASRAILLLAETGMFQMIVSQQVLDEVERNLRLKVPKALPTMVELLASIRVEVVVDPVQYEFAQWLQIIEFKDAPILHAALNAKADYLITLNTRDFTPKVAQATGLIIMEPGEFVGRLRELVTSGLD